MKYNAMTLLKSALTYSSLCLLTSSLSFANENIIDNASSIANKFENQRWFEIEVILFKQVTKSSEKTEVFNPQDLSYRKQHALDLLNTYLHPDITSLKQLLPRCEEATNTSTDDFEVQPYSLWVNNINLDETIIALTETNNSSELSATTLLDEQTTSQTPVTVIAQPESSRQGMTINGGESISDAHNHDVLNDTPNKVAIEHSLPSASPTEPLLKYTNIKIESYNEYPTPIDQGLCIISDDLITKNMTTEQLERFNFNEYPVEKIPTTISGIEQWQDDESGEIKWASESPYLINQDSLQLKSIANRIKRSRNYEPLLHIGWRQAGEQRRKAKSVRLYAGDNLALDYQQGLNKILQEQKVIADQKISAQRLEQEKEQRLSEALRSEQLETTENMIEQSQQTLVTNSSNILEIDSESDTEITELSTQQQIHKELQQQQLNNLFEQYAIIESLDDELQSSNKDTEIKHIIDGLTADITVTKPSLLLDSEIASLETRITPPEQPWYLDGLFRVHLDHYLYINSEFTILDGYKATPNEVLQQTTDENNIISFKQDRRVITGEIHYFDHPHIGMVVQIRRFDPTKPAAEAVTQAKK